MPRAMSRELSSVKFPQNRNGVRFATRFLVGTQMRFSLHLRSTRKLTLNEAPIVTIVGKAFWDIGHAPKDQSNRRKYMPGYAVWEIHPVMKIDVQ
jgi:hypothetical protein